MEMEVVFEAAARARVVAARRSDAADFHGSGQLAVTWVVMRGTFRL